MNFLLDTKGFVATEFEAKAHERAKRAAHRIYVGEVLPTANAD